MNRRVVIISLIILLIAACTVIASEFLLIKNEGEPLRTDPGGTVIAQIPKNSKLELVETSGKWVKVKGEIEVQGWVKKESTTLEDETSSDSGRRIEGGFVYNNIHFINASGIVKVKGELTNNSSRDYHIATFKISAYNNSNEVIASGYINIGNFSAGTTKNFTAVLNGRYSEIKDYKIEFITN